MNNSIQSIIEQWYKERILLPRHQNHASYKHLSNMYDGIWAVWDEDQSDSVRLIILSDDSILYRNQIGGHACHHKTARGFLITLPIIIEDTLVDGSCWWAGDAKEFFQQNPGLLDLFEPNGESEEAWIQVVIKGINLPAILIYENSD